jgi:nucleotide-binding universal stress UspA family protein
MSSRIPPVRDGPSGSVRRILAATDFSPAARLAVWRAGQLAQQNNAHLHVVHAHPDWDLFSKCAGGRAEHFHAVGEDAERCLSDELRYLEGTFGIKATGETRMGRASEVLHKMVAEASAQLVIVGARGEHDSPTIAPFLGGTALKLIAFANVPVLVVRNPGTQPYSVSAAVLESSSASAFTVFSWARSLVSEGECHLVHAFDAPYVARLRKQGIDEASIHACVEEARQSATHFVDEVLTGYAESKQQLSAHLVCGEPVAAVLGVLKHIKPDVAVLGKHEHSPRDMHLRAFGSVTLRIAYHAMCDVLVVP